MRFEWPNIQVSSPSQGDNVSVGKYGQCSLALSQGPNRVVTHQCHKMPICQSIMCSVQCAVCSLQCAVCNMQHAACRRHCLSTRARQNTCKGSINSTVHTDHMCVIVCDTVMHRACHASTRQRAQPRAGPAKLPARDLSIPLFTRTAACCPACL